MVLVLLDDGTPWLLRTDGGADGSATLVEEAAPPTPRRRLSLRLPYDRRPLAPATAAAERADANAAAGAAADAAAACGRGRREESEDEDDLALYGRAPEKAAAEPAATAAEVPEEGVEAAEASVICVACGASGELLMYALPAWTLLFTAPAVAHAPHVLANALAAEPSAAPAAGAAGGAAAAVLEVRLCAFAHAEWAPLLAVLVGSRQLYVYRTTAAAAAPADGGAAVRFVRFPSRRCRRRARSTTTTTRRRRRCRCRRCRLSSCACRNSAPAPAPRAPPSLGGARCSASILASSAVARGARTAAAAARSLDEAVACAAPFDHPLCAHGVVVGGADGGSASLSSSAARRRAADALRCGVAADQAASARDAARAHGAPRRKALCLSLSSTKSARTIPTRRPPSRRRPAASRGRGGAAVAGEVRGAAARRCVVEDSRQRCA